MAYPRWLNIQNELTRDRQSFKLLCKEHLLYLSASPGYTQVTWLNTDRLWPNKRC